MICPTCSVDVAPFSDFTDQGIQERCPRAECGAVIVTRSTAIQAQVPSPAPAKRGRDKAPIEPPKAFDVIKAAKARLREVERQIKLLKALETERDKLQRLLNAAERPLAAVKPLRGATAT